MPYSFQDLLGQLTTAVQTDQPKDVVQYCADWFQARLRDERLSSSLTPKSPLSTSTTKRFAPPPAMALPAFNGLGPTAQPSPFSEHGPTDSPFSSGGASGAALAQRRATMAAPGAGLFSANPFAATAPAPAQKGLGNLQEDAGEEEDEEDPQTAANTAANAVPNSFANFSFNVAGDNAAQASDESPFGAPDASSRFPPPAPSSGAAAAAASSGGADELVPPSYALGRRTSVSAESLVPTSHKKPGPADSSSTVIEEETPTAELYSQPKTESQLARIRLSISQNFLFRNLDEDQERDVLAAMREVQVKDGEVIIEQGAAGDFFYVVESGTLDIFVKKGAAASDGHAQHQVEEAKGEALEAKWGKKVHTAGQGGSFGELALMYNAPRAATVIANQPSTLWALDRISFRTILLDHTSRKRRMYETFLASVPILSSLEGYERAKIADALESRTFVPGEEVVKEGEPGDEFYLIESGVAEVEKNGVGIVAEYSKGDYFGELALLNRATRAATVRAAGPEGSKLRVAALGEKAFTRLLGPVRDIMARKAGERYGLNSGPGGYGAH